MSENKTNIKVSKSSEKNFGIILGFVCMIVGLYPLISGEGVRFSFLFIAALFFVIAYVHPKILSVPNDLWFKLGIALGAVVAPVVMVLVFFCTVVPIGLIMRLLGNDLLRLKLDKTAKSYWIDRNQPVGSMKNQF